MEPVPQTPKSTGKRVMDGGSKQPKPYIKTKESGVAGCWAEESRAGCSVGGSKGKAGLCPKGLR